MKVTIQRKAVIITRPGPKKENKMLKIVLAVISIAVAKSQLYDLEFKENGQTYKEMITVDKLNKLLMLDVPRHGNRGAAIYLKDFQSRLSVMKENTKSTCYVWDMKDDEPTPDSVVKGLKQVNGKFPNQKYWVENENMLPLRKYDVSRLPNTITQFCSNYSIVEVGIYNQTEMEKVVLQNLKNRYAGGRTKRALNLEEYQLCTDSKFVGEVKRCYQAGRQDLLVLRCKILLSPHCSYTVSCKKQVDSDLFTCPDPVHTMTQIHCCVPKCMLSTAAPTVVTNQANKGK